MKSISALEFVHISTLLIGVFLFVNDMSGAAWSVVCLSLFALMLRKLESAIGDDDGGSDEDARATLSCEQRRNRNSKLAIAMVANLEDPLGEALRVQIAEALELLHCADDASFAAGLDRVEAKLKLNSYRSPAVPTSV